MVKIGMVIGDRYEIQELIGTGGMSDVYKARCNKLNRNVAVKILKQEFSENREFVAKFRREAEAAANLMHPNIVTVYDVGEENGISYIVMELVDGYTLKEYIEKKSRLAINECISIAIPIASGIEAAHNKGIIHRDIKPQNVIISKDGKVKVTDFGIAKTTTSNTISSNVMGSVHYTSPEQARGGFSDEKSDIYSLGITLFEMVTGRVPFNGDTTVAIAIKHIQEEMPSPRIYVEDIPISIEQIILKCTQKSPDRRYQKMSEVIEDLKKAYISPNENFVKIDTYEKNSVTKTNLDPLYRHERKSAGELHENGSDSDRENLVRVNRRKQEGLELPPNVKNTDDDFDERPIRKNLREDYPEKTAKQKNPERQDPRKQPVKKPVQKPTNQSANNMPKKKPSGMNTTVKKRPPEYTNEQENKTVETIKTGVIVGIAVIIGLLLLFLLGKVTGVFGDKDPKATFVKIPPVTSMAINDATKFIEDAGLKYEIIYEVSDTVTPNRVISTNPSYGSSVEEGSTIEVVVSKAKEGSNNLVPDVSSKTVAEATAILENNGYVVEKIEQQNEYIEKGKIIEQNPMGGSETEIGSTITLVVSLGSGKEKATMPDLTGKTEEEARALVSELGMSVVGVSEEYSDTVDNGKVCGQSYTSGSVIKSGSEITLKLSLGPEPRYYKCNTIVQAPEKYTGGSATIVLKTENGQELFNTIAPPWPVSINISNIYGVSKGIIEITYTVTIPDETVDEFGNPIVTNSQAEDKVSYEVEFE